MKNLLSGDCTIKKVFNNNVLLVCQYNKERILFGKGIGFGKHLDEVISNFSKVDKVFVIDNKENSNTFNQLVNDVDNDVIGMCEEVIYMISTELGEELNEKVHISLTDHIAYTLKRLSQKDNIENPFLVEIETLYKKEFEIAKKAVKMIEDKTKLNIPDSEAGFIALHIHSARNQGKLSNTIKYAFLSSTIVEFIEDELNIEIDRTSLDYARFITHIRFAVERILNEKPIKNELLSIIKRKYKDSYKIAKKVAKIIENELELAVVEDEVAYISVHIERFKEALDI